MQPMTIATILDLVRRGKNIDDLLPAADDNLEIRQQILEDAAELGPIVPHVGLDFWSLPDDVLAEQNVLKPLIDTVAFAEENWGEAVMGHMSFRELIDSAVVPEWIVEGVLPYPSLSFLYSQPKAGKTTMLLSWLEIMIDGGEWAGRAVEKAKVLYLTEEGGATISEAVAHIGLDVDGPHRVFPIERIRTDWNWNMVLVRAGLAAQKTGCKVVVIDTMMVWAQGEDGNAYGEMTALMRAARACASIFSLTVLLVHHDRKGRGGDIDSALGSTALVGGPDHLMHLRKDTDDIDKRYLNMNSRFRGARDISFRLHEDGQYREASSGGTTLQIDRLDKAFEASEDGYVTRALIMRVNGVTRDVARIVIKQGINNGRIEKVGEGNETRYRQIATSLAPDDYLPC